MEYMYAALLLHKAGKKVEEKPLKDVLKAAGVKVDDARVKALVAALEGVDIEEVVSKAPAMAAAPAQAPAPEEAKEEKKEEEKEEEDEKAEEEAAAGLGALFG